MAVDLAGILLVASLTGFLLLPLGVVLLALGLFRRVSMRCARCGYDVHGLPSGAPCPECGNTRVADHGRDIPRKRGHVWAGAPLIALAVVPVLILLAGWAIGR